MTQQAGTPEYALRLSEQERMRYRFMAARALEDEGARWAAAGVVAGARIADVGCGPGAVLVELARIAGESGEVIGIEPDPAARAAAEEEIAAAGVAGARVIEGTGAATGLEPASFDVVMIRHVLFHAGAGAPDILRHCATLLRPGGHLYVVDTDATASRLGIPDPDPDAFELWNLYWQFQADRGCNITIGPLLGPMLVDAGLEIADRAGWYNVVPGEVLMLGGPIVAAIPALRAAGRATDDDEARWRAGIQRVAATPGAAVFTSLFVAVGRKLG